VAIIAIIDDDAFVREALDDLITSLGHRVRTYQSAAQFLESSEAADTSFLITDMQMPGMSGLDLQQHLLANGRCTPVIFLTAFPEERAKALALNRGAVAFLSKPLEEAKLLRSMAAALKIVEHNAGQAYNATSA
jgi:FixJ family two-component response regulator